MNLARVNKVAALLERAAQIRASETHRWDDLEKSLRLLAGEAGVRALRHARLAKASPWTTTQVNLNPHPEVQVALYFDPIGDRGRIVATQIGCVERGGRV